jgi:hypothetical protein
VQQILSRVLHSVPGILLVTMLGVLKGWTSLLLDLPLLFTLAGHAPNPGKRNPHAVS